jgi:membrane carboxypeptidase/penicillin-binding protein
MNTPRTLIAASLVSLSALFAASGAVAQEATPDTWTQVTSTASRADVQAQAATALRAGLIESGEASRWNVPTAAVNTRDQVRAEAIAALQLGLTDRGEANAPAATPAEAEMIRQAGLRALSVPVAQLGR